MLVNRQLRPRDPLHRRVRHEKRGSSKATSRRRPAGHRRRSSVASRRSHQIRKFVARKVARAFGHR